MIPTSVVLSNYRSFGGPDLTTLELRPITLLFGRNGAGKSALLRSLPLIADSLSSHQDDLNALNLGGRLSPFHLSFENLRWKGRAETDEIGVQLGLRWDGDPILHEVDWIVREVDEWNRLVVDALNIRGRDSMTLQWRMKEEEQTGQELTYGLTRDNPAEQSTESVKFRGLAPELQDDTQTRDALDERLRAFASSVLWLHSLRPAPERHTPWKGAVRWSLDPDGHDAPIVLWGNKSDLLPEVSSFFEENLGLELRVEKRVGERLLRTFVQNRARADLNVDLVDTGEGLSEVLPVLTALAMVRRHKERGGPSILAIEEPGSHLHPDLQRALMERICKLIKDAKPDAKPRIVLETHSEIVLRTVILGVVRGDVSPNDVAMYWVRQDENGQSKAERIRVTSTGKLEGNWPPGTFRQNTKLAAAIQDELYAREEK